ncbi:MAG: hypothetical protein Q4P24_16640 [Rhodobacterales bacterium]|nr:hypothetical protein [Rhodobacterales bacterium]
MPKIFTTKDKNAASNMLLEGASVKAVAAKFGVHVSTIYALRKDRGHGYTNPNRASRNVHVRLTNEEFAALDDFVTVAGFPSRTAALRSLIRAATGFLELSREDYLDLVEVRTELRAQGRNLNQIAHAMNKAAFKGQVMIAPEDKAFLSDVRRTYVDFDGMLSSAFREVRQLGRDALHTAEAPVAAPEAVEAPQDVSQATEAPAVAPEAPQGALQAAETSTAAPKTLAGAMRRIGKP